MKAHIRALLHATPFQPFVIRMVDGREYRVEHPDFVLASSSQVPQVIIEERDGQTHFLSVLLMSSVTRARVDFGTHLARKSVRLGRGCLTIGGTP
jgi:hypothetical protein